jgi:hypothetical protein
MVTQSSFRSSFGITVINAQNLYMEYNGEKVQICQFQEKLIVVILGSHVQVASNKAISHSSMNSTETEEKVKQNRKKHRCCYLLRRACQNSW